MVINNSILLAARIVGVILSFVLAFFMIALNKRTCLFLIRMDSNANVVIKKKNKRISPAYFLFLRILTYLCGILILRAGVLTLPEILA